MMKHINIERQKWIDHAFETGIDIGWTKNILCRAQDTAIRLAYHCQSLNEAQLSRKQNNDWSIKEHIGHLADLEELWTNRFLQFKEGKKELSGADMSNAKTTHAGHNEESVDFLIMEFTKQREHTLRVMMEFDQETQDHQAFHPRIKKLMRPIDLLFFVAEHDDHHLASIKDIKQRL